MPDVSRPCEARHLEARPPNARRRPSPLSISATVKFEQGVRRRTLCRGRRTRLPLAQHRCARDLAAMTAASVLDLIGNTPLVWLKTASEATGCEILGKAEFLNPGQSVKDRAALYIIRDAERRGLLQPGGRIVEGTA